MLILKCIPFIVINAPNQAVADSCQVKQLTNGISPFAVDFYEVIPLKPHIHRIINISFGNSIKWTDNSNTFFLNKYFIPAMFKIIRRKFDCFAILCIYCTFTIITSYQRWNIQWVANRIAFKLRRSHCYSSILAILRRTSTLLMRFTFKRTIIWIKLFKQWRLNSLCHTLSR